MIRSIYGIGTFIFSLLFAIILILGVVRGDYVYVGWWIVMVVCATAAYLFMGLFIKDEI